MKNTIGLLFISFSWLGFHTATFAQASETGWTMTYSESEAVQKLLFVGKGEVHGAVYFRCKPAEGWIFLIHDKEANRTNQTRISSSDKSAILLSRREIDEVDGTFYLDNAVPANDSVIDNFAAGNAITIDGITYPIRAAVERTTISNFVKICEG